MYFLYRIEQERALTRYHMSDQISLFGCNAGWIPRLLRSQLSSSITQPHGWHLPLRPALQAASREGHAIVIDIKPANVKPPLITICELTDVWGFSAKGWTPIMMRMESLLVDEAEGTYDKRDFTPPDPGADGAIYSFLYLAGSIREGALVGRWTPPKASPTNAALLWPEPLSFFMSAILTKDPSIARRPMARPYRNVTAVDDNGNTLSYEPVCPTCGPFGSPHRQSAPTMGSLPSFQITHQCPKCSQWVQVEITP